MTSTIDAATQTARPTFTPTAEELASFQQRGYLGPFDVYGEDEMRSLWRRERLRLMDRSEAVYDEDAYAGNTNIANYDRHLDSTFLADHICRPEIVDRVAAVLGPDVLCWRSEFFPKYPGDEGTDWHQADTFAFASGKPQIVWPDDQREQFGGTITVWTAFTEAAEDTGCLQFIPGTQRTMNYDESRGMHYSPDLINGQEKDGVNRGFYGYDYRELQKDPDWRPPEDQAVSMVMKPGQAILFWSTLMHASKPHSAPDKPMRLGFAGRYVPTCVDVYPDTDDVDEYGGRVSLAEYGAVLVSGTDRYTHNRKVTETTRGHRFPKR